MTNVELFWVGFYRSGKVLWFHEVLLVRVVLALPPVDSDYLSSSNWLTTMFHICTGTVTQDLSAHPCIHWLRKSLSVRGQMFSSSSIHHGLSLLSSSYYILGLWHPHPSLYRSGKSALKFLAFMGDIGPWNELLATRWTVACISDQCVMRRETLSLWCSLRLIIVIVRHKLFSSSSSSTTSTSSTNTLSRRISARNNMVKIKLVVLLCHLLIQFQGEWSHLFTYLCCCSRNLFPVGYGWFIHNKFQVVPSLKSRVWNFVEVILSVLCHDWTDLNEKLSVYKEIKS